MTWTARALLAALLLSPLPAAANDPDAAFAEAEKLHAVAEYAGAAARYEDAAKRFPAASRAPQALKEALVLRLALGDLDRAAEDADTFEKLYGKKRRDEARQAKLLIAAYLIERGAFAGARKRIERLLPQVDQFGSLAERLDAHTWLGRCLVELGDAKGAEREFDRVLAMWKDPQAAVAQLDAGGGDEPARLRRVARALTHVGEALFFFAEQQRAAVDAIRFPVYHGPARKEEILKHFSTRVADWTRQKRAAIEVAEGAYRQVLSLAPAPPPRWVVASAARVGHMGSAFVDELRAAPIPAEWKRKGAVPGQPGTTYADIRNHYEQQIGAFSEPLKERAKAAFKTCLASSVKFQYFDAHARSCAAWLTKHDEREYPPIDELLPSLAGAASSLLPAPLPDPRP